MAKLVLLNILLFLLVAAGSSIAWPSYSNDAERDTLSVELEKEDRHAVANLYNNDAEVATYGDNADTADNDDNMAIAAYNQHTIAEINRRRHGRKGRRKGRRKGGRKGGRQRPKNKSG